MWKIFLPPVILAMNLDKHRACRNKPAMHSCNPVRLSDTGDSPAPPETPDDVLRAVRRLSARDFRGAWYPEMASDAPPDEAPALHPEADLARMLLPAHSQFVFYHV
tara:strand:- start:931 stop:1248 length:318 start_codon:yes stop_codon:yes gene_type:complete